MDCSVCVTIGGNHEFGYSYEPDGESIRNLVGFFELAQNQYMFFQRITNGRKDTGGDIMHWLDIYRIDVDGQGEFMLPTETSAPAFQKIIEGATDLNALFAVVSGGLALGAERGRARRGCGRRLGDRCRPTSRP